MIDVTLTIGGRHYAVACAPGEEAHLAGLGRMIDAKLAGLPGGQGQGESRALLFAALLLADELHEARNRTDGTSDGAADMALSATQAEALAERLEALADLLESSPLPPPAIDGHLPAPLH
jgi:cell division protein ZapA